MRLLKFRVSRVVSQLASSTQARHQQRSRGRARARFRPPRSERAPARAPTRPGPCPTAAQTRFIISVGISTVPQPTVWPPVSANSGAILLRCHRSVADVRALAGRPLSRAPPGAMRRPAAPGHHLPAGLERLAPRGRDYPWGETKRQDPAAEMGRARRTRPTASEPARAGGEDRGGSRIPRWPRSGPRRCILEIACTFAATVGAIAPLQQLG
jgi:hypothetical protein